MTVDPWTEIKVQTWPAGHGQVEPGSNTIVHIKSTDLDPLVRVIVKKIPLWISA